ILAWRSLGPLLLPKTLMGNAYRLGGHLADLAPAATLFTPSDAHVDRDGNDKPMYTVALDANRLCKHRVGYTAEAATSVEKSEEGGAEGGVRGRWIYGAAERGDSCRFRAALVQNAPVELQPTTHK
ncbi:hypothetical protein ALC53_12392, partial [Atta colombica]